MLNKKGFTLVELLATMVILGVVMAFTIPNIIGIGEQNKATTYVEDAKKFKNTAEYMFRGDDSVEKPKTTGDCILVNLRYIADSEFNNPPYGGKYLMDQSFVVMMKNGNKYLFYVQLLEQLPNDAGYRGIKLVDASELEGNDYFNKVVEMPNLNGILKLSNTTTIEEATHHENIQNAVAGSWCNVKKIYYAD